MFHKAGVGVVNARFVHAIGMSAVDAFVVFVPFYPFGLHGTFPVELAN